MFYKIIIDNFYNLFKRIINLFNTINLFRKIDKIENITNYEETYLICLS